MITVLESSGRDEVRASGARVEELLESFDRPQPPGIARARAEELARELVQLYGQGFERVLEIIDEFGAQKSDELFARFCEDKLVSGLMAVHGLHPLSPAERVTRALESVRPYVESHKGHVEVIAVEESIAVIRMSGSCDGCPSSEVTLKLAIERAVLDACPDITAVRAE